MTDNNTIFGLEPDNTIEDNWTPLEAIAVVKCIDEDGTVRLSFRVTKTLSQWEAIGMLRTAEAVYLNDILQNITGDED